MGVATSRGKYAHRSVSWRSAMKRAAWNPQLWTGAVPSNRSTRMGSRISAAQPPRRGGDAAPGGPAGGGMDRLTLPVLVPLPRVRVLVDDLAVGDRPRDV